MFNLERSHKLLNLISVSLKFDEIPVKSNFSVFNLMSFTVINSTQLYIYDNFDSKNHKNHPELHPPLSITNKLFVQRIKLFNI